MLTDRVRERLIQDEEKPTMGGIRPETRAMKRRKVAKKNERRLKKITPNKLGIPPQANLLRKQIREALSRVGEE